MTSSLSICEISSELKATLKDFRFRKDLTSTSAVIVKVDRGSQTLVVDQIMENTTLSTITSTLPSHQPRFVVLSYRLEHGSTDASRLSFPLCFLFITPRDSNPSLQMMYAGSKLQLQREVGLTKVFELRELEELDEEWLEGRLLK